MTTTNANRKKEALRRYAMRQQERAERCRERLEECAAALDTAERLVSAFARHMDDMGNDAQYKALRRHLDSLTATRERAQTHLNGY